MSNLLKAEFYKLTHSWYFWGIGLFNCFLSSVLLLDSKRETANLFFASLYNTPLLYFLIIVFSALFVGNDFAQKTIYQYVSSGHKRGQIIFAKTVVYQIACVIILVIPVILHGLLGRLFLKEVSAAIDDIAVIMITIGLSILAMCMLPLFFSFLFQDMGKSLTVPMLTFLIMIFLMNGKQAQYITKILPMGQLRLISLQELSLAHVHFITIDLLWIFILYLGAYFIFCHSNLK